MIIMKKFLLSRKFLTALASILFIVLTQMANIQIDPEAYWSIVGTAIAYILGQSYVDSKEVQGDKQVEAVKEAGKKL